jgi:predicted phosphoribosyltransferase/tRNA(Ser,Leu) C12 N-acetylase TAN1
MAFVDRRDAGRRLAAALARFKTDSPVVLALPRGGVAVAAEVAAALSTPLDLVLVRKIGVPFQPELAMGAVVDGPEAVTVRNEDVIAMAGVSSEAFASVRDRELAEIERRRARYLGNRTRPELKGRTVILIDDGIATGATFRAAIRAVRAQRPVRLVLAVPVAPPDTLKELKKEVDEAVCLEVHAAFGAIGSFYDDFRQVSDEEVIETLARFPVEKAPQVPSTPLVARDWNVVVTAHRGGGRTARRILRRFGRVERSGHYNVFLLTAAEPSKVLDGLELRAGSEPVLMDVLSRVAPAQTGFDYQTTEDFERELMAAVAPWLDRLRDKSFHVRLHRRGKGLAADSQAEEARLGEHLLATLAKAGGRARIDFEDPDLILAIDAVDGRAGVGLWTREDLGAYRFLKPG